MCLNNTNKHMTFVYKQCTWHRCLNNTSSWMTFASTPYEPMKRKFRMIIIPKLWPMKFMMWGAMWPRFGANLSVKWKLLSQCVYLKLKTIVFLNFVVKIEYNYICNFLFIIFIIAPIHHMCPNPTLCLNGLPKVPLGLTYGGGCITYH
jgi:hypothetical protein